MSLHTLNPQAPPAVEPPPAAPAPGRRLAFKPTPPDDGRRALLLGGALAWVLTLAMVGMLARVAQLQLAPAEPIARLADDRTTNHTLPARRGNLVDRHGRIIATSGVSWKLYVDPALIADPNTFPEHLAHLLGYDAAQLARTLDLGANPRYLVLDPQLPQAKAELLRQAKRDPRWAGLLRPVDVEMWQDRQYPLGSLAGQLVGFVGREGRGLEGAEAVFNTELAGQPGGLSYVRDSRRRPIAFDDRGYLAPRDGEAVTLSLDLKLQAIVQEELSRTCAEFTAESGHVVMMNPFTGEVLAMASFPFFDPREALGMLEAMKPAAAGEVDKSPRPWQNRSVTEVFEPGSTFKTFVWAAATQGRHARVDEIFHCGGGSWVSSRGRSLRDAAPVGTVTWAQVLVKSSNIGMAMVGERMGPSRLHRAVRAFGFGQTTGSGLQGEQAGLVVPLSKWTHYSVTSVPMGQEVAVTGLQMCRATAAIANGGLMVAPTLRRVDADDYARDAQVIERVLDPNAAATTLATLRRVATEGTARQMKSSPYAIFGKTGTAQVPRTGNDLKRFGPGYEPNAYTACFIGGAPVEAPRVVVACFIRKPDKSKGYYGGIVAGPCVQRILERTLQYLGVPHSPREEPQPTVTALAAPRR